MRKLSPALKRAYRLVERAAEAGEACPTNQAIAAHMGISSIGTASGYLSRLQDLGVIRVERGQNMRCVTILATGKQTRGRPSIGHVSKADVEERQRPLAFQVDREPCLRCGVRPDVGCGHSTRRLGVEMSL